MKNIILVLLSLFSTKAFAQQNNFCGQSEMEQKYLLRDPAIKQRREALEKFTADYTSDYFLRMHQNKPESDSILFVIPVVFHIMHDYGPENISKADIMKVMTILNKDYQKRNQDTASVIPLFKPIIGDCQVEFRLAQLDPQGNCTDGITHHQTELTNGGDDALKQIVQWPPDRYLNIWVEKFCSIAGGYSYFPGISPGLDGIVIGYLYLENIDTGSNNLSEFRILSHEAGHYFNLFHTWGLSGSPGLANNCDIDDLVFDTPNTIGSTGCNLSQSSCTPGVIDNVQNIMDYSTCIHMFTQGQCARMQAALNSSVGNRNNLWSAGNRLLTGTNDGFAGTGCAPVADFSDKKIRICEGQSITLYNQSYSGDFTTINWQFPGGNIVTSTDSNPTVQYNTAGFYDVTLTVANNAGTSTLVRNALVEVSPAIAFTNAPFAEDFESLNFPSGYWNYESDRGTHWEVTSLASVSGTKSVYLQNDSANILTSDIFYTDNFNLTATSSPSFTFKVAIANRNNSNDNLKIFMSTDCGETWVLKYTKSGSSLETANDSAINFIPASNEWREDGMNISAAAGQSHVRFKFQFDSEGGNNIFIDDININGVTGFEEIKEENIDLSVAPNPASQQALLSFELFASAEVSYSLTDAAGKTIFKNLSEKLADGKHSFAINKEFPPGLYFLDLKINRQHFVKKVVFE